MKMNIAIKPIQGFSLVELLVAMTLGLFLMTGVLSVFLSSKQSYAQQDALGQMQENARFALELLARETRMAGFGGCSAEISIANTISTATTTADIGYVNVASTFANGLTGYLGDATNSTFPDSFEGNSSPNTDAVIIHSVDNENRLTVNSHVLGTDSATITFSTSDSTLQVGDIAVLVDANCTNMAIYANTGPANPDNDVNQSLLGENAIAGRTFTNCEATAIKGNFTCTDTSSALSLTYSTGSSVYRMNSFAFYIGPSTADASILSLYRQDVSGTAVAEELVEGITDLDMFYGLITGTSVQYFRADGITAANWINVESVRYRVTVRSLSLVEGTPVTQTFTTTIKLRNRG